MKTIGRLCTLLTIIAASGFIFSGCMEWDYGESEDFEVSGEGLFIVNEGNFQYSNSSLTYYNPESETVENEVFARANGFKLGDVAQSMTIYGDRGWIAVNNSKVVFAIDINTFREVGRIENLPSPRFIHFVNDRKAYITQLWSNQIIIFDPSTYQVTGYITIPGMSPESGSTEQMVQFGKYVFCNMWSFQNRIIKIDTETDTVVDELTVGVQPTSLAIDCNGKLWTVCDGGYEGNPFGYEAPSLFRIDAESFTVERQFKFRLGDMVSELNIDREGNTIYWLNGDVWKMSVDSNRLPVRPVIKSHGTIYYGLTVSPANGDIYVADAIDYRQQGIVYRYSQDGDLIDEFYAGISPGAFCWR